MDTHFTNDLIRLSQKEGQVTEQLHQIICDLVERVYDDTFERHSLISKAQMIAYASEKAHYDTLRVCPIKIASDPEGFYLRRIKNAYSEYISDKRKKLQIK